MTLSARILLADSDARRRDLLHKHLRSLGYLLSVVADGVSAQRFLLATPPDLAILAEPLPGYSTLDICRSLREHGTTTPILAVHAADSFRDRVISLDGGADDALSFPCALEEFSARVNALLRRSRMGSHDVDGSHLSHRDLFVDTDSRSVSRDGRSVRLTVKEYELLLYLLRHKGQTLSRHQILVHVWGDTWVGDDNLLDVYIRYLRKKIEFPGLDPLVHTVRGVGFRLA